MIRACAGKVSADLIVMGTNQRHGLQRFPIGSVAQEVLLDAAQDVLVVPLDKSG
ncbi:universal stress protein [Sphingomonas sp. IC-56]|nr:universal stress protein [Sphingomonas sp. IC-56]